MLRIEMSPGPEKESAHVATVTISRACWAVQQLSVTLRCIAHPLVLPPSFRYPSPRSRTVLLGRMAGPQPACDATALGPEARGSAVCAACLEPSV